jgi:hypothetical protein
MPRNLKRNFSEEISPTTYNSYQRATNTPTLTTTKTQATIQPTNPQPNRNQPMKPKESGKCWGCGEPWTPEHKFVCKFKRAVQAMALQPDDWLAVEQAMELDNHILLHPEVTPPDNTEPPQLLMISNQAVQGTTSVGTFSLVVSLGGKKGIALVDSESIDTFMDYFFASKLHYNIISYHIHRPQEPPIKEDMHWG